MRTGVNAKARLLIAHMAGEINAAAISIIGARKHAHLFLRAYYAFLLFLVRC